MSLDWFDTKSDKIETARADAIKVTVSPAVDAPAIAPEQPAGQATPSSAFAGRKIFAVSAAAMVLILAVLVLIRRYRWPLCPWVAERRRRRDGSKAAYFRRIQNAFTIGDRMAVC